MQPSWHFSFSADGRFLATDATLSSPATGAPRAAYTCTIDLGPHQTFFTQPIIAFSPTDHRLLIADCLGRMPCLP